MPPPSTLSRPAPEADEAPIRVYGRTSSRPPAPRSRGRLVLALLLALLAGALWLILRSDAPSDPAKEAEVVRIVQGGKPIAERPVEALAKLSAAELAAWAGRVPAARRAQRGGAVLELRTRPGALSERVQRALRAGGGTVAVPERTVSADHPLPIVKQVMRNNCETAALSMLLRARRVSADQLALQRELPRSGPLDPTTGADGQSVWGDPQAGYVGRPEGGGAAGGYGVYERPILALARKRGARLRDLSSRPPRDIYRSLLAGRPVMVWIGLTDGPFESWRTPEGKPLTGNFGEHTVVLTGIDGDTLAVNDPLVGERTNWTREEFELMWRRLGSRAISS